MRQRWCPEKKENVSEERCEGCIYWEPKNIGLPCKYASSKEIMECGNA